MTRRVLFATALLAACRTAEPVASDAPIAVRCEAPAPRAVDDTVSLRGRIQPPPGGDLPVASQVAGRLAQVVVHEGDSIREGDPVAILDDANTRDALRQADATVAQARASQANADVTLERTRALVARGIAARQELDDAVAKSAEAKANLAAVAAGGDLARRTLGRITIRSSFAGTVTRVWRGAGALVDGTAATPVVQVAATGLTEFVADAPGPDLTRIQEGDAVRGSLAEGPPFEGTVRVRARALDPASGLGSIRIALTTWGGDAPIGSFGRATVIVAHREGVRTLPATALRGAIADGAEVAICQNGHVAIRAVGVGWRDDQRFEVQHGVEDGERVAVDHALGLEDGNAITETP